MDKKIIKPIFMVFVFVSSLIITSIVTNHSNEDLTTSMQAATLPLINLYYGETPINELHGYVNEMDVAGMRDSITPIAEDRKLSVRISGYGRKVGGLSYEIRNMDASRLVADGKADKLEADGNVYRTTLQLQNILNEGEEYVLILIAECDSKQVYYYTRIVLSKDYYARECLDFALEFHDYTFRDDAASFIPTYMDPASGDATTLNYVDLSCTLKQITWADFQGEELTDPIASFKEINSSYNVIVLQYVLTSVNESGETEYYNIEEYYRLRQTDTRMYVLNFERTMNQIFRGENNFVSDSYNILLGIRSSDVEYRASEAGDVICFVQEGELWCYHVKNHIMARAFSFLGVEGIDSRENWGQHDIKIIRMDEAGSVDFIVYGYMNRGNHEGEVGMGVFHYDGLAKTVEEEAFVPFDRSYEVLKSEMGQLMYENEQGMAYLMMEGSVYAINLDTLEAEPVVEGLSDGGYAVSESHRYLAWVDDKDSSTQINIMDLGNGSVRKISEGDGIYMRPLGFLEEDFIYGAVSSDKVVVNAAGNTNFPMEYLKIIGITDKEFEELKEYSKLRRYIESIDIENGTISINLIKKSDGQYMAAGMDSIMNREADYEGKVEIGEIVTGEKETQIVLSQSATLSASRLKMITPKTIILDEPRNLSIPIEKEQTRYYVYTKGKVDLATDQISDAIKLANNRLGVVVDEKQNYIWMRARKSAQDAISGITPGSDDMNAGSIVQCISAILSWNELDVSVSKMIEEGSTPKEVLEESLRDARLLDLAGCTVDEILFYVSCQNPVFVMTGKDSAVLITGYDSKNIYYYDPDSHTTQSMSITDADKCFEKAGGIFFAYLES